MYRRTYVYVCIYICIIFVYVYVYILNWIYIHKYDVTQFYYTTHILQHICIVFLYIYTILLHIHKGYNQHAGNVSHVHCIAFVAFWSNVHEECKKTDCWSFRYTSISSHCKNKCFAKILWTYAYFINWTHTY